MDIHITGDVLNCNDDNLHTWPNRLWIYIRFYPKFSTYYYTSDCFNH